MRGADIKVGQVYAVEEVHSGWTQPRGIRAFPRTTDLRKVEVVDKAPHGILIGIYEALVPDPKQHIAVDAIAARLMPNRKYVQGHKTIRFRAEKCLCLWEDYQRPGMPDGRIDAPRVTNVGGLTITEERLA